MLATGGRESEESLSPRQFPAAFEDAAQDVFRGEPVRQGLHPGRRRGRRAAGDDLRHRLGGRGGAGGARGCSRPRAC